MSEWEGMDTAPKMNGLRVVEILLQCKDNVVTIGYWDDYYAKGGKGYEGGLAWIEKGSGDQVDMLYDPPIKWMPLPPTN